MAENIVQKQTDKKVENSYNIYRTCTQGEPALVVQSLGRCMVDHNGKLTNEARRTIQSIAGEQAVRSITGGKSMHFHLKGGNNQAQLSTVGPSIKNAINSE